jgi:Domain of unknown function (DUF4279)
MSSDNVVPFPQRGISVGGPVDDASVSLDIYGDDLDPDEITQLLGLSPTYSHRRGDRLRPDGHSFHAGAWLHQVKSDDVPGAPELALGYLLDRLPSDASLWARLVQQFEIRLNFRIGFTGWSKGFVLSAPTIQRAAVLGVRLEFDLYASENQPPELDKWTPR